MRFHQLNIENLTTFSRNPGRLALLHIHTRKGLNSLTAGWRRRRRWGRCNACWVCCDAGLTQEQAGRQGGSEGFHQHAGVSGAIKPKVVMICAPTISFVRNHPSLSPSLSGTPVSQISMMSIHQARRKDSPWRQGSFTAKHDLGGGATWKGAQVLFHGLRYLEV